MLFGFGLTANHELAHQEIYKCYNIDSKISYNWDYAITTPLGNYSNCDSNCELAHNINEVVGYHLQVIYVAFGIFSCLLIYSVASIYFKLQAIEEVNYA